MPLIPGSRLGPYEIVSPLGAGGMGEVYRARDTKLGREVALKILSNIFVADADRLARFEREAKTLASLNHPNIAQLYGVEESGATPALIMELVQGPTLADRIAAGPLALSDALPIAKQIADALEAAHEQGIIHRDLKPANVKVRDDGTVKVLDFGLAKALAPEGASAAADAMNSPTITAHATQMGMIIGTAAYMAPEQARGKVVDRRADIWSFGVVLTELLTGERAFTGDDVTEVLARVIEREPDLSKLPATTPPSLRRLIDRCLMKDPKQRLRDIGEARIALAEAERELARGSASASGAVTPESRVAQPVWRRALPWALSVALLIALGALGFRSWGTPTAPAALTRLQITLPPGVELHTFGGGGVSLSPDGSTLAFVGVGDGIRRVYERRIDQFDITPVRGTETANACVFSPDGRTLLVGLTDTSLHRIRLLDGFDKIVTPMTSTYWTAWSNDRVVFSREGHLWISGDTPDAAPTPLTSAKTGSTAFEVQPVAVPGGKAVLFVSVNPEASYSGRIEAVSLADHVRTTVVERASSPVLTSTGHLLFLRDGILLAAAFDAQSLKTTEEPRPVLNDLSVVNNRGVPAGIMAVSETGVLVYASTKTVPGDIVSVSWTGEEQVVRSPERPATNPRMSPIEDRLIFEDVGNGLWDWDRKRPTPARLADGDTSAQFPIFTRDGLEVIFRLPSGLFRQPLNGGAKPVKITGTDVNQFPTGTTPNDAEVLYTDIRETTKGDLYMIPLVGGKPQVLVNTTAYEGGAQISPDGKWMVYVSDEVGGVSEVFLKPYPSLKDRWPVSSGGGIHPVWNPKGGEILYRNGLWMMSVNLTVSADGRPLLTSPRPLFSGHYAFANGNTIPNFSIERDGTRFILVKQSAASLNVVLNWFETLKRVK